MLTTAALAYLCAKAIELAITALFVARWIVRRRRVRATIERRLANG